MLPVIIKSIISFSFFTLCSFNVFLIKYNEEVGYKGITKSINKFRRPCIACLAALPICTYCRYGLLKLIMINSILPCPACANNISVIQVCSLKNKNNSLWHCCVLGNLKHANKVNFMVSCVGKLGSTTSREHF